MNTWYFSLASHNLAPPFIPSLLDTNLIFLSKSKSEIAPIYFASDNSEVLYECGLLGDYQFHNKKTVLQTIQLLQAHFEIDEQHVKLGFKNVVENTGLLGRWQILNKEPFVVCDTAHNSHGLKIVLNQIQKHHFDTLHVVLGVVNDKDLESILPLFPRKAKYYFCKPNVPRGLDSKVLQEKATDFGLVGDAFNSVSEAYETVMQSAKKSDFIYIGGSTFVVAEIL
mgnify:FL=1